MAGSHKSRKQLLLLYKYICDILHRNNIDFIVFYGILTWSCIYIVVFHYSRLNPLNLKPTYSNDTIIFIPMLTSPLLTYWFSNSEVWFNCSSTVDIILKTRFADLFSTTIIPLNGAYEYLHYIILYDQITRHLDRVDGSKLADQYHPTALAYSNHLIDTGQLTSFTSPEICFILLPLRHSKDLTTIYRSLSLVQGLRSKDHTDSYLRRFHYATVKSLADITVPRDRKSVV